MRSPAQNRAYRFLSLVVSVLLLLSSLLPVLCLPYAYAEDEAVQLTSEEINFEEADLLSPEHEEVDATRLVAWPKEDVKPEEIDLLLGDNLEEFSASLEETVELDLISNPREEDFESLVVIESDEELSEDVRDQMMATGLFEAVDYDVLIDPMTTYVSNPNDTYYANSTYLQGSWGLRGYPGANFSAVWSRLAYARGTANTAPIAVIDTGFNLKLEDRGPNIVAGYDFALFRSDVTPQVNSQAAYHGVSTAGIIAAATNNKKGVAGAAWDNKVIIYKAADAENNLYLSAVTNSINDVVAKRNARIINMSLGGSSFPSYFQMAIDSAVNSGIIVIAAAGNTAQEGNYTLFPAAYPPVLSVASIGPTGQWSNFSTYNASVDIAAPGEMVAVMRNNNTYGYGAGTSFAAPHVAAAAALVWRADPNLSAAQVQNILIATAKPIGTRGNTRTGAGALDASAAYERALGLPSQPKISKLNPGAGSVKVNWTYSGTSSTALTGYILWYRAAGQSTWKSIDIKTNAKQYSYTVGKLKDNTKYYFKVSAVSAKGRGPISAYAAGYTYTPKMLTSKSTVRVRRGKTVRIRIAPHYCVKRSQKVSWSSSKPKIATISSLGSAAKKKGAGTWTANSVTDKAVASKGKQISVKGERRGTAYLTFKSAGAKCKVKVIVF